MKKYLRLIFQALTIIFCCCSVCRADVPATVNFQGRLTDAADKPLEGSYSLKFTLYDVLTGGTGLWTETQSVSVSKGIYSCIMGSVTPINLAMDKQYYLEVAVNNEVLAGRQKLSSVPYALNSQRLGGLKAADFLRVAANGNVGIATTSPGRELDIIGGIRTTKALETTRENVASYQNVVHVSGNINQAGTLKITLPKYGSNTMLSIRIVGYNYSGGSRGTSWEVVIGGYNYYTHAWYHYFAEIRGAAPFNKVRLGNDGSKDVILLGDTTTVWQYPKVAVVEVLAGYSNYSGWDSGWSMKWITDEAGIAKIATPAIDFIRSQAGNIGIGTTAPAAKLHVQGSAIIEGSYLKIPVVSADPSGSQDGMIWYNSAEGSFKCKQQGTVKKFALQ